MKFNKITKVAILPAAAVGVALAGWAVADAGAGHASENTAERALSQATSHQSAQHGKVAAKPAKSQQNAQGAEKKARAKRAAARRAQHWVVVRRGESLSTIAKAHHMTWQAIYATPPNYKHIANPNHLRTGERLRLPDDPKMRAAEFRKKFEAVQRRMQADAHRKAAPTNTSSAGATGGSITAGMTPFEACVAWRESGDTPTDPAGLFGILPSTWASLGYSGTAGQASVAVQEQAFNKLYAQYGTAPWAPYDGC